MSHPVAAASAVVPGSSGYRRSAARTWRSRCKGRQRVRRAGRARRPRSHPPRTTRRAARCATLTFWMGEQIVVPAGVSGAAVIRRHQDHVVTVGEIRDRRLAPLAAACTGRRQDDHWEHAHREAHAPPGGLHDRHIKPCGDHAVDRRTGLGGHEPLHPALPCRRAGARVDAGDSIDGVAGHVGDATLPRSTRTSESLSEADGAPSSYNG